MDLKPCPFCGSEAERKENKKYRKGYQAAVGCKSQLCSAKRTQATLYGGAEDAYKHAENAWNSRPERKELTVDELKERHGQPVWCHIPSDNPCWGIVDVPNETVVLGVNYALTFKYYGEWKAFSE